MCTKHQVHGWSIIVESKGLKDVTGTDGVIEVLKLSYEHLSSEMKQCFAFCAIFPEDYDMEKDMLIQMWMANDFKMFEMEWLLTCTQESNQLNAKCMI